MNVACAIASSFATHRARPFRIMFIASMPCKVRSDLLANLWMDTGFEPIYHRALVEGGLCSPGTRLIHDFGDDIRD